MKISYDQKKLAKIAQKHGLRFIILHGSHATGKTRVGSDVDIAVLGKQKSQPKNFLEFYQDIARTVGDRPGRELDLKMLDRVDPFFRYQVIRSGILLYGNSTDYEDFKAFAYRAYEDARPLLELEHHLSKKYQQHLNRITRDAQS